MRRQKSLQLLLLTVLVSSGCSSSSSQRRSGTTNFKQSRSLPSLKQYDADPPGNRAQQKATQAGPGAPVPPVPPARGVSHVKGISLSRIFGYPAHNNNCGADPTCAVPADSPCCDDAGCTPGYSTGVAPCLLNCWSGLKTRITYWPTSGSCGSSYGCCPPDANPCTPDATCTAPALGAYCPQGCGDRDCTPDISCHIPSRLYCPPQQSACVPEYRVTERYCAPECPKIVGHQGCGQTECGAEGCTSRCLECPPTKRPSLLSSLFCYKGGPQRQEPCVEEGCATRIELAAPTQQRKHSAESRSLPYGYGVAGDEKTANPSRPDTARQNAPQPPDVPARGNDAASSPRTDSSTAEKTSKVPAVPSAPQPPVVSPRGAASSAMPERQPGLGTPQSVEDVPAAAPAAPAGNQPLSPMRQTQIQQTVEPARWPRLNKPSLASDRSRPNFYRSSGWSRH